MFKRISSLLFVGIVGYTLGTMSTLYAGNVTPRANVGALAKKIDQVISGQKNIEKKLQQIWFKVK